MTHERVERRRRARAERDDQTATVVHQIVRQSLDDRMSFRKGGTPWSEYLFRLATPERVLLAGLTVIMWTFTLGGELRDFRQTVVDARKAAVLAHELRAQQDEVLEQLAAGSRLIAEQHRAIEQMQTRLDTLATKAEIADVSERMKESITRGEFQRTINSQIVPRLARIEQSR